MQALKGLRQMTLFFFRGLVRNKIAFFFNLVMPVIFLVIFGMMNLDSKGSVTKVGLLDRDHGPASQLATMALQHSGLYELVSDEEAALYKKLETGSVRAIVVLPEGLSEQVNVSRVPGNVVIWWDPSSTGSQAARSSLENQLRSLEIGERMNRRMLTVGLVELEAVQRLSVMDFMMPGMLIYMLLNAGVVSVAISVASQRQSGAMRHMFSTPLMMQTWLGGRVLANVVLSVVQLALIWVVGITAFKVHPPANPGGSVVILLLSAVAGLAIGMAIGVMVKHADIAMPIALVVSMVLTFLGNAMVPLDQGPQILLTIMKFMPSYYMTHALQQVMMKGQPLTTVVLDLGVLATTSLVFLSLAGWRLRKMFVVNA